MSSDRIPSAIPLFGQNTDHSFVAVKVRTAVARSGGPGRPSGRRTSALPLTAASRMAALMVYIVAMSTSSMLVSNAADAERASSVTDRANGITIDRFAAFVTEASKRFAVPEHWIRSVMRVESAGEVRARSRKGAMGLMQIMPGTWADLRARYGLGADPYDTRDNILAGAAYLHELYQRFGMPGFLAAYNAGPGRYENHLATGRPLPDETQGYVVKLAPTIESERTVGKLIAVAKSSILARSPLFARHIASNSNVDQPSPGAWPDRRSSVRAVVDRSALVPQSGNLFVHRAREFRSQ
jgi:Transglycosylase SLT domain